MRPVEDTYPIVLPPNQLQILCDGLQILKINQDIRQAHDIKSIPWRRAPRPNLGSRKPSHPIDRLTNARPGRIIEGCNSTGDTLMQIRSTLSAAAIVACLSAAMPA